MANSLVFIRRSLYQLKRQYGNPLSLSRQVIGQPDMETGAKSTTSIKMQIDLAIIMPVKAETLAFYTNSLLKAGREFAIGGFQDQDMKTVIIDGQDLPDNFEILQNDYAVYRHKKYEISKIEKLEEDSGYLLTLKGIAGMEPNEVHEASVYQSIRIIQNTGVQ